jgi:serine phosphatase RsbU (regulator of sigma subunit)
MTIRIDPHDVGEIIRKLAVFEGLEDQATDALVQGGAPVEYQDGEFLIRQGDTSDFALILIVGAADVLVETTYGTANLASLEAPALVGEIGVFTNAGRTASIQAKTPIRAVRLGRDELHEFGQRNPAFLSRMMLQLGRRLETVNKAIGFYSHALAALERNEFDVKLLDELTQPLPELADFSRSFLRFAQQILLRRAQRAEMANARAIQAGMLPGPHLLERCSGYVDVQAFMRPAKDVGGDLYDFFLVDEDHLALAVGDVCGKGIPAALFMAMTQLVMRYMLRHEPDVGSAATAGNALLAADNPETMFTTWFCGILDLRSGVLSWSSCGHHSPLILRSGGQVEKISTRSLPLGIEISAKYATNSLTLTPGDRIVFFTDGFTDAVDGDDKRFGDDGLEQTVAILRSLPSQDFIGKLVERVDNFAGTTPQFDDMTALIATVVARKAAQSAGP